jgi:hypothetical protein
MGLNFARSRQALYWLSLTVTVWLFACTPPPAPGEPCNGSGFILAPTATRLADPDLFSPPAPPPNGGDDVTYCPTPIAGETPPADFPTGFVTTEVTNLSLDGANQELAAAAVGDDMLAVAWISGGDIYVALTRGGSHFQVRRVDSGSDVALTFSRANRLHVAYEQNGQIFYRAADQGTHPADVAPIFVEYGQTPQVVVDELNWAHVLYEQDGSIYQARHLSGDAWFSQFVVYGTDPAVLPFYNEKEVVFFGIPSNTYWFGIFLAATHNGQLRLFRYLSWFNLWQQVAAFPIPAGEALTGRAGLDYLPVSGEEAWVYAAWVTQRPNATPPLPGYSQPIYAPANPLYPDQIANPGYLHNGLNAARWYTAGDPFDAGLQQTVNVPNPNDFITFSAWGLADTAAGADLTLRIGIDPTGGDSPESSHVVWSAASAPDSFTHFSVSAPTSESTATLFLHATLTTPDVPGTAVWDVAAVQNGDLVNGDFEGVFIPQSSLTVPEGWTAYYRDSANNPASGRDVYTVYAVWSTDGGSSWSTVTPIAENRDASGSVTGAIRPAVYPLISTATETPAASLFYIYETGDPPPSTTFLRFGRPTMTVCELGTADCTDSPGLPLLPPHVVRPSTHLLVAADPFNPDRATMTWDGLQTDYLGKDVYATYLVVR